MRDKYWLKDANYSTTISALDLPNIMGEWVGEGLTLIFSGERYNSAIDRASLFALFLRVQRLVPDYVPYLGGASYAVIPEMLVPRFLDPEQNSKPGGYDHA